MITFTLSMISPGILCNGKKEKIHCMYEIIYMDHVYHVKFTYFYILNINSAICDMRKHHDYLSITDPALFFLFFFYLFPLQGWSEFSLVRIYDKSLFDARKEFCIEINFSRVPPYFSPWSVIIYSGHVQ